MIKFIIVNYKEGGGFMATKEVKERPLFGNRRSHALNATRHAQKPNIQKKTVNGKKIVQSARKAKVSKRATV